MSETNAKLIARWREKGWWIGQNSEDSRFVADPDWQKAADALERAERQLAAAAKRYEAMEAVVKAARETWDEAVLINMTRPVPAPYSSLVKIHDALAAIDRSTAQDTTGKTPGFSDSS